MKKRIIALLLSCISVCLWFSGCKDKKQTDFYPYKLSDYIVLGDYHNVSVSLGNATVEVEDVEAEIKSQLAKYKKTTQVEKQTAIVSGDTAIIDFVGYMDGKAFEGGTAQNYSLEIGSNSFIEGFETGLIGKKAGDKTTLELKFPANYHQKDFANKAVKFDVTVNKVTKTVYPELTDELVSKISPKKTVDEYRSYVYDTLLKAREDDVKNNNYSNLVSAIVDCCEIKKYPKTEVREYKNALIENYKDLATQNGITLETLIMSNNLTEESFDTLMEDNAKQLVAKEIVFLQIAEKENITLTDEEYETGVKEQMKESGFTSKEEFFDVNSEDKIRGLLTIEKAIDYTMGHVGKK